ncbi:dihydropteroate synthase [Chloroflexota bacterium]
MKTLISSATREVLIGDGKPTVIIGERINPAGKKKMAEALRAGDLDYICREAAKQIENGADIIDINVTLHGLDEISLLPRVVEAVMKTVDAPLCIDSANSEALLVALKIYKGKALINSVTGEERSLAKILPMVKEYGAAVVGLTQDDAGIPADSAERRLKIAEKIVSRAVAAGIARENVVIDCLAMSTGAHPASAMVTLEAVRMINKTLGVNITLGAQQYLLCYA